IGFAWQCALRARLLFSMACRSTKSSPARSASRVPRGPTRGAMTATSSGVREVEGSAFPLNALIDSRIDVCAQFALLRMLRADPVARADATGMLAAVKAGELHGIFNHTTFAVVQLARGHGVTRFDILPRGENAALVLDS